MSGKDYSAIKFIDGTMSTKSYSVFARQGHNVIAVRPLGIQPAGHMQGKEKVFVFCRLRSASGEGLYPEAVADDAASGEDNAGVVMLVPKHAGKDWAAIWPNIKFEKNDARRASSIYGAYIDGDLEKDPEGFVEKVNAEKILEAMAVSILEAIGEEYLCVRKSLFVSWFVEKQGEIMTKQLDYVLDQRKKKAQFEEMASGGEFGSHFGAMHHAAKKASENDPSKLISASVTAFPGAKVDTSETVEIDPVLADLMKAQQDETGDVFAKTSHEAQKTKAMFGTTFDIGGANIGYSGIPDGSSLDGHDGGGDDPDFSDDDDDNSGDDD